MFAMQCSKPIVTKAAVGMRQHIYLLIISIAEYESQPEDALFVARARGVIKEDWVKRRKEQGKL